ncbi:MAG: MBL fold metallo-hydrolase [Clostridia bacterium]|nr:MBL fold metallo-hydrolase [Clostridia bacterium]
MAEHDNMNGLTKLTPHIHRLTIPFLDIYTTVFVINTEAGAVLFDTATYPEDIDQYIVPALAELGISASELKYAVISHNHRDHAGGLARFAKLFPDTVICAGSEECGERVPGRCVKVLGEGDTLACVLTAVSMPGHTPDCVGILDTRTKTLLSGDALQLYGIYGSGAWGANIRWISEHLELGKRLHECDLATVVASHDYHPCGWRADGKAEIDRYIDECANALYAIRDFISPYLQLDDDALAEMYNSSSKLPTVGKHVIKNLRELMDAGKI